MLLSLLKSKWNFLLNYLIPILIAILMLLLYFHSENYFKKANLDYKSSIYLENFSKKIENLSKYHFNVEFNTSSSKDSSNLSDYYHIQEVKKFLIFWKHNPLFKGIIENWNKKVFSSLENYSKMLADTSDSVEINLVDAKFISAKILNDWISTPQNFLKKESDNKKSEWILILFFMHIFLYLIYLSFLLYKKKANSKSTKYLIQLLENKEIGQARKHSNWVRKVFEAIRKKSMRIQIQKITKILPILRKKDEKSWLQDQWIKKLLKVKIKSLKKRYKKKLSQINEGAIPFQTKKFLEKILKKFEKFQKIPQKSKTEINPSISMMGSYKKKNLSYLSNLYALDQEFFTFYQKIKNKRQNLKPSLKKLGSIENGISIVLNKNKSFLFCFEKLEFFFLNFLIEVKKLESTSLKDKKNSKLHKLSKMILKKIESIKKLNFEIFKENTKSKLDFQMLQKENLEAVFLDLEKSNLILYKKYKKTLEETKTKILSFKGKSKGYLNSSLPKNHRIIKYYKNRLFLLQRKINIFYINLYKHLSKNHDT